MSKESTHEFVARSRNLKQREVVAGAHSVLEKLEVKAEKQVDSAETVKKVRPLRELLFLGALTRDVEIDGFVFGIKTLTHKENREVAKRILLLDDKDKLVESNTIQVCAGLVSINGLTIDEAFDELFGDDSDLSTFDKGMHIFSSLNSNVGGKLIEEFYKLSTESNNLLSAKDSEVDNTLKK